MKKNILFIHQSSDLYGSDKAMLYLVKNIDKSKFNPIVVIPKHGPLLKELQKSNIRTIITPVLNIHRKMFSLKTLMSLPFQLFRSIRFLNRELKDTPIHMVQTNTVVVLLGFIYARLKKIKHCWHIHEILNFPRILRKFFPNLIYFNSKVIFFNSEATKRNYIQYQEKIENKAVIIHNGTERNQPILNDAEKQELKKKYCLDDKAIILGLVGRINANKGHFLLLDAFKNIHSDYKNIKLAFIGSTVSGKEEILVEIQNKISELELDKEVIIIPFQENIWKFWDFMDIAVVPSTIEESFGLVALEAMLAKKPVVASNLGGLVELVDEGKTGYLFDPFVKGELEKSIRQLISDPEKAKRFGEEGYKIAKENFTLEKYTTSFENAYIDLL